MLAALFRQFVTHSLTLCTYLDFDAVASMDVDPDLIRFEPISPKISTGVLNRHLKTQNIYVTLIYMSVRRSHSS